MPSPIAAQHVTLAAISRRLGASRPVLAVAIANPPSQLIPPTAKVAAASPTMTGSASQRRLQAEGPRATTLSISTMYATVAGTRKTARPVKPWRESMIAAGSPTNTITSTRPSRRLR